jgi:hypothetical protein
MLNEIRDVLVDAAVVCGLLVGISVIGLVSHTLVPPNGPVFFEHTRFEFPFQWMIDGGHIANFGAFIVRTTRRMWR